MCLHDVKVGDKGDNVARFMFDGGSEGTLILDSFAKAQNFRYIEASYTLGGMGGATVTYTPSTGGKIYSVILKCTDGSTARFQAYSVKRILGGNVGRDRMKFEHQDFPHLIQDKLNKIGLPLPRKPVQVLIGNLNLSLQPKCHNGFGCPDCGKDRCILQSKFGAGWVPLGNFGSEDTTSIGSI